MSKIKTLQAKARLYEVLFENLDVNELDGLESLGMEEIYEEIGRASYDKQELRRIKAMEVLNVQTCSSIATA